MLFKNLYIENATEAMDIPPTDGVCFEEVLHTLK